DLRDARRDDRPRTHDAGLERDVERAVREPPSLDVRRCLRDGEDLRVGRRILEELALVVGARDDALGRALDDHGAHGHLVRLEGPLGLLERLSHEMLGTEAAEEGREELLAHAIDAPKTRSRRRLRAEYSGGHRGRQRDPGTYREMGKTLARLSTRT